MIYYPLFDKFQSDCCLGLFNPWIFLVIPDYFVSMRLLVFIHLFLLRIQVNFLVLLLAAKSLVAHNYMFEAVVTNYGNYPKEEPFDVWQAIDYKLDGPD